MDTPVRTGGSWSRLRRWLDNQAPRNDEIERSHEARRRIITKANTGLCGLNCFWG